MQDNVEVLNGTRQVTRIRSNGGEINFGSKRTYFMTSLKDSPDEEKEERGIFKKKKKKRSVSSDS